MSQAGGGDDDCAMALDRCGAGSEHVGVFDQCDVAMWMGRGQCCARATRVSRNPGKPSPRAADGDQLRVGEGDGGQQHFCDSAGQRVDRVDRLLVVPGVCRVEQRSDDIDVDGGRGALSKAEFGECLREADSCSAGATGDDLCDLAGDAKASAAHLVVTDHGCAEPLAEMHVDEVVDVRGSPRARSYPSGPSGRFRRPGRHSNSAVRSWVPVIVKTGGNFHSIF